MDSKIEDFRNERTSLNSRILSKEHEADILKRVFALDTFAYNLRGKGLSPKMKETLGLVTSMVLRCDDCVKYHLEKCYELGVADDEMMDIFGIASVVGGTIVIPHTRRAIEYWEILLNQRPEPSPFAMSTKNSNYNQCFEMLRSMLEGVENPISKMATIVEVLSNSIPYYYWTGFYLLDEKLNKLTVGPYQGTHGCLFITLGEGVCGRAAKLGQSLIVDDLKEIKNESTAEGQKMYISCDARCNSEIVVPVFDKNKKLLGVFDVDSLHKTAFDEVDKTKLEEIMNFFFS